LADSVNDAAAIVRILCGKHVDVLSRARKTQEDRAALSNEQVIDPGRGERLGDFLRLQRVERRVIIHSGGAG